MIEYKRKDPLPKAVDLFVIKTRDSDKITYLLRSRYAPCEAIFLSRRDTR